MYLLTIGLITEIATVITPYTATSADQLSLAPGQLIRITRKDPSGWWDGELQVRLLHKCTIEASRISEKLKKCFRTLSINN
jgi:hypothetical protein